MYDDMYGDNDDDDDDDRTTKMRKTRQEVLYNSNSSHKRLG